MKIDLGFGREKKKEKMKEGSLTKTASVPSYLERRDSPQTATMPYGAGPQAGLTSQAKQEKTEEIQEPEPSKENENPPYVVGRDEVKPPAIPYGAGPQAGFEPQPPVQKPPSQSGGTEEEPYVVGRDEWEPPAVSYAPGLQAGFEPKDPGEEEEAPKPEPEKQAPRRTAKAVLEELNSLEQNYDDMLREAEAWESQAARQKTPDEISRWEKKGRELRQKATQMEPYLDSLQKEWEYAMNWEWEAKKEEEEGYRDPTLRDLTIGSFQQGYDTAQLGRESYRDMLGDEDNRKTEYEEKLAGEEYKFMPEGPGKRAVSGVARMLGQEFNKWTDPTTIGAGMAAGMGVAAAGNAGPQALIPEEVITVPGAFAVGANIGAAKNEMEIQAGLAYDELLKQGVSEETAQGVALAIGGVNAVLDAVPLDSLLQSLSIFQKKGSSKKAIEVILNELEKRGIEIAGGVGQDVLQEGVTIAGVQAGTKMDTGEWAYTTDQVIDRLGDTAGESLLTNAFSEAVGGVKDTIFDTGTGKTSWISDETALKISEDRQAVDYLSRKGGLTITKNMSPEQKIAAVRNAVTNVIQAQKDKKG